MKRSKLGLGSSLDVEIPIVYSTVLGRNNLGKVSDLMLAWAEKDRTIPAKASAPFRILVQAMLEFALSSRSSQDGSIECAVEAGFLIVGVRHPNFLDLNAENAENVLSQYWLKSEESLMIRRVLLPQDRVEVRVNLILKFVEWRVYRDLSGKENFEQASFLVFTDDSEKIESSHAKSVDSGDLPYREWLKNIYHTKSEKSASGEIFVGGESQEEEEWSRVLSDRQLEEIDQEAKVLAQKQIEELDDEVRLTSRKKPKDEVDGNGRKISGKGTDEEEENRKISGKRSSDEEDEETVQRFGDKDARGKVRKKRPLSGKQELEEEEESEERIQGLAQEKEVERKRRLKMSPQELEELEEEERLMALDPLQHGKVKKKRIFSSQQYDERDEEEQFVEQHAPIEKELKRRVSSEESFQEMDEEELALVIEQKQKEKAARKKRLMNGPAFQEMNEEEQRLALEEIDAESLDVENEKRIASRRTYSVMNEEEEELQNPEEDQDQSTPRKPKVSKSRKYKAMDEEEQIFLTQSETLEPGDETEEGKTADVKSRKRRKKVSEEGGEEDVSSSQKTSGVDEEDIQISSETDKAEILDTDEVPLSSGFSREDNQKLEDKASRYLQDMNGLLISETSEAREQVKEAIRECKRVQLQATRDNAELKVKVKKFEELLRRKERTLLRQKTEMATLQTQLGKVAQNERNQVHVIAAELSAANSAPVMNEEVTTLKAVPSKSEPPKAAAPSAPVASAHDQSFRDKAMQMFDKLKAVKEENNRIAAELKALKEAANQSESSVIESAISPLPVPLEVEEVSMNEEVKELSASNAPLSVDDASKKVERLTRALETEKGKVKTLYERATIAEKEAQSAKPLVQDLENKIEHTLKVVQQQKKEAEQVKQKLVQAEAEKNKIKNELMKAQAQIQTLMKRHAS